MHEEKIRIAWKIEIFGYYFEVILSEISYDC